MRKHDLRRICLYGLAVCLATCYLVAPAQGAVGAPSVSRVFPDVVGPNTTTLRATINPNGADTTYKFEYGATTAYGTTFSSEEHIAAGTREAVVSKALQGLSTDTTYHYRVVATNMYGSATSGDKTFSTFGLNSIGMSIVNAENAPETQAGSHPYEVTTSFKLPLNSNAEGESIPAGGLKDVQIELPPGLVGNPNAVPQCPHALLVGAPFGESACPADTQVGVILLETVFSHISLPIYNMVPSKGLAAQFGVYALLLTVTMDASVRTGHGYRMVVSLDNLTQVFPITGTSVTLWGVPADPSHDPYRGKCLTTEGASRGQCPSEAPHQPFLTLPTECGSPLTLDMRADSWEQPGGFVTMTSTAQSGDSAPLDLHGCERLIFAPTVSVSPENKEADAPTGLTINVSQSREASVLAPANIGNAIVTLPEGMSINPAMADGLGACTVAQVSLESSQSSSCPDSSKIGTAEIETPLLNVPLVGSIYLAQPNENPFGSLLAAYVVVAADNDSIKLPIDLTSNPTTGRLSIELPEVPDLPFSKIKLVLPSGARAALASPMSCGTFTATTQLTPHSPTGGMASAVSTATSASRFAFDVGCGSPFTPSFVAGSTTASAGRGTGFTLQLASGEQQQSVEELTAALPPGLLGNLGSVPLCSPVQASDGSCDPASEIGTATLAAGAGPHPFYLSGKIFLTGPYSGAPFGLSIVVPANVGPFDLGTIVVRAKVSLAPSDLRLLIASDPLPQILDGIPLRLRTVGLQISRPGFLFNPTSCMQERVESEVKSVQGSVADVASPFRVTGCDGLSFEPGLTAATEAKGTNRGDGASFQLTVAPKRDDGANVRSVAVSLPSRLRPRLTTMQRACRAEVFRANPSSCPASSIVGRATVTTPALVTPLTGPMFLVFAGAGTYPEMRLVLQGGGVMATVDGVVKVSKRDVVSTVFNTLPDVPLHAFTLVFPRGPHSILGAVANLCNKQLGVSYTTVGYNGERKQGRSRVTVAGCRNGRAHGR